VKLSLGQFKGIVTRLLRPEPPTPIPTDLTPQDLWQARQKVRKAPMQVLITLCLKGGQVVYVPVKASFRQGNLAVHKHYDGSGFAITHLPTGCLVASRTLLREAKALAIALCQKALYENGDTIMDVFDEFTATTAPKLPGLDQELKHLIYAYN